MKEEESELSLRARNEWRVIQANVPMLEFGTG